MTIPDPARRSRRAPLPFAAPFVDEDEIQSVVEVLRSGWLTTGTRTREFEVAFGEMVGDTPALAVSSGTAALHLALVVSGIGPGTTVFTTPMTFCATAHVIEHVGARPVLVDVDSGSLNMDPEALETAVARQLGPAGLGEPAAVIPVHYAGQPCDMEPIVGLAARQDLAIVEDAAHAFGAAYRGRPVGALAPRVPRQAVCFSLYATKNITTGEGGVLTGHAELVERAREWSLHGMSRDAWRRYEAGGSWRYDVVHAGFKYNLTDLQSALGLAQLRRAQALHDRRRAIAQRYSAAFAGLDEVETPRAATDVEHAWHLYVLRLHLALLEVGRDEFIDELSARGIGASVHFTPLHLLSYYRDKYGWSADDVPVADAQFPRMLSLPIYPRMTDEDVEDVVAAVRDVVHQHRKRVAR